MPVRKGIKLMSLPNYNKIYRGANLIYDKARDIIIPLNLVGFNNYGLSMKVENGVHRFNGTNSVVVTISLAEAIDLEAGVYEVNYNNDFNTYERRNVSFRTLQSGISGYVSIIYPPEVDASYTFTLEEQATITFRITIPVNTSWDNDSLRLELKKVS